MGKLGSIIIVLEIYIYKGEIYMPSKDNIYSMGQENSVILSEERIILQEIAKAKLEWNSAEMKLNYVTETEQIDYAIYALGAAEKRYNMLIRQAKKAKISFKNF